MGSITCSHCRTRFSSDQALCSNCGLPSAVRPSPFPSASFDFTSVVNDSLWLYVRTWPELAALCLVFVGFTAAVFTFWLTCSPWANSTPWFVPTAFCVWAVCSAASGYLALLHRRCSPAELRPSWLTAWPRAVARGTRVFPACACLLALLAAAGVIIGGCLGPGAFLILPLVIGNSVVRLATWLPMAVLEPGSQLHAWRASQAATRGRGNALCTIFMIVPALTGLFNLILLALLSSPHGPAIESSVALAGLYLTLHASIAAFPITCAYVVYRRLLSEGHTGVRAPAEPSVSL